MNEPDASFRRTGRRQAASPPYPEGQPGRAGHRRGPTKRREQKQQPGGRAPPLVKAELINFRFVEHYWEHCRERAFNTPMDYKQCDFGHVESRFSQNVLVSCPYVPIHFRFSLSGAASRGCQLIAVTIGTVKRHQLQGTCNRTTCPENT